jgi:hypothetical protein
MIPYKHQLSLFYPEAGKKASVINFSGPFKDSQRHVAFFLNLEGLSTVESEHLADWSSFVLSYKRMEDPYLLLQVFASLNNYLAVGVTLNNLYLERVKIEFGVGEDNEISHDSKGNLI